MSPEGNDSNEVVAFLELYARFKDLCDGDLSYVEELYRTDDGFQQVCDQLVGMVLDLRRSEDQSNKKFVGPTNPTFVAAFRDYENRFDSLLHALWLGSCFLDPDEPISKIFPNAEKPLPFDDIWEQADSYAQTAARYIEVALSYVSENLEVPDQWTEEPLGELAAQHWHDLTTVYGFDLRRTFRRRTLVPFVLLPRHVARKYGASGGDMLQLLEEAHAAFIFGANRATISFLRAILERVLRTHYKLAADRLEDLIRFSQHTLPKGVSASKLHKLRRRANAILHERELGQVTDGEHRPTNDREWEEEIYDYLRVIRLLIEGAPARPS